MIAAKKLNFSYGKRQILYDIDFYALKSQSVSLIGPNGSGKSTLLRCLSGRLRPHESSVEIEGEKIERISSKKMAQKIGFLPQFQVDIHNVSVSEIIYMGRAPYQFSGWIKTKKDKEMVAWAMAYMKVEDLKNRMVHSLSGGERQRVWIAMVLAQDTPIVLLDEPITYMDMKHQWNLLNIIHDLKINHNKTVISVFHDINHAIEVSDIIYMLKDGKVQSCGNTDQTVTESTIREVYGIGAFVCRFEKCNRQVVIPESSKGCKCEYKGI